MEVVKQNLGKVAITVDKNYWDINRYYDRLVIVEVKNEYRTYISRKPVPAGVFITNRDFWIPFSSLKEELVANFNAFVNKINGNETIINQILDNQKSFDSLIAQLQDNIRVLDANLRALAANQNQSDDTPENPITVVTTNTFYSGDVQPIVKEIGYCFFDTVLGIPIWWNGVNWVNSDGINVTRYDIADSYDDMPASPTEGYIVLIPQDNDGYSKLVYRHGEWVGETTQIGISIFVKTNGHVYTFTGTDWTDKGLIIQ